MFYRSCFRLRVACSLVVMIALLARGSAINGQDQQDQPLDYKLQLIEKLTNDKSRSELVRVERNHTIVSLKQSNFPKWLLDLYSKELDARNPEAVYDIAKIDGLWSEDFATRLVDIFGRERSLKVRNTAIDAITKHRSLTHKERIAMTSLLRVNGELELGKARADKGFIELLGRMGDSSAISYLAQLLPDNSPVVSGIGLSQPILSLPRLRISDCAHDAIVSLAGGNFQVRVAVAYRELGFSNEFDPRSRFDPMIIGLIDPNNVVAVQDDDDELVTRSGAEDERRMYREVQVIRDKLNSNLSEQLVKLGFILP